MAWYQCPLHSAVVDDKLAEMADLISNGQDVNEQDASKRTPLDYCVSLHASYVHIAIDREEGKL